MNYKDCIKIALKNIKIYKLQSIIFVISITLLIILGNIFLNYSYTIDTFYNNFTKYSSDARTIFAYKKSKEEDKTYQDNLDDILNYNHIIYGSNSSYNVSNAKIKEISNDKLIYLYPYSNNYPEKIHYGRKKENNNEIICPRYLSKIDNPKTKKDLIDMKKYLNKEITTTFYQTNIIDRDVSKENLIETINFKVVGLYDNSLYDEGAYEKCYIDSNLAIDLYEKTKTIYNKEYLKKYQIEIQENGSYGEFIVDSVSNIEEVTNLLEENGYETEGALFIDTTSKNLKNIFSYSLFVALFIIIAFIISFYINNILKKRKKDIALYKTLGYKNKTINKILFYQILILYLIAFILNITISLIGITIINNILSFYISKNGFYLTISFLREVIYFMLLLLLVYINIRISKESIDRLQIRDILKSDI